MHRKGFLLFLFGVFIIPELKGRSLEEVDELFNAGLKWGWQFSSYRTEGTGAQIAALEDEDTKRADSLGAVRNASFNEIAHKEKA